MQTATLPTAKGKTTVQEAIETARARAEGISPSVEKTSQVLETVPVAVKEPEVPVMPETPKDIRTVVELSEDTELEIVKPAEIKNGQLILTPKHLDLIKTQIAKDATPAELELFLMMAYRTRLDPLMRQLYFIKYGNNVSYVTSIDGYRIIAHRTGDFAGVDFPIFEYDTSKKVTHASITVYKMVQGVKCGFSAKVKFTEYNSGKNQWAKMPETMIAKVAEAHALRKAFPNDLSGIYTQDEMDQAENKAQVKPSMASEAQRRMIMALLKQKGRTVEDLKEYLFKAFKITSSKQLTIAMAKKTIDKLQSMPTPIPIDEPIDQDNDDDSFEAFAEAEMANGPSMPDMQDGEKIADDVMNAIG